MTDESPTDPPLPEDSFAKIFHEIEQAEDRILRSNHFIKEIAKPGFLDRHILLGPFFSIVKRNDIYGNHVHPLVYRTAIYGHLGLGVVCMSGEKTTAPKRWQVCHPHRIISMTKYESCPFIWQFIVAKRHFAHLHHLAAVLRTMIRLRLRELNIPGDNTMAKKPRSASSSKRVQHSEAIKELLKLTARLIAIAHLKKHGDTPPPSDKKQKPS